jgi:hypothetical protein
LRRRSDSKNARHIHLHRYITTGQDIAAGQDITPGRDIFRSQRQWRQKNHNQHAKKCGKKPGGRFLLTFGAKSGQRFWLEQQFGLGQVSVGQVSVGQEFGHKISTNASIIQFCPHFSSEW